MANVKHYVITALVLGAIGGVSAAAIGGVNALTRDRITQNEIDKVNKGIKSLFSDEATIESEESLDNYQFVNYVYCVNVDDNFVGYAFRTTGSNEYGKISLLVGLNKESESFSFIGVSVITNEQTYASTLVDNYIDPLNEGERELSDVSCGATYGAKLVRDMVNEAKEVANEYGKE